MDDDGVLIACFGNTTLKYTKAEFIGRGTFGIVFKAQTEREGENSNSERRDRVPTNKRNEYIAVKEITLTNKDLQRVLSDKERNPILHRWKSLTELEHANILRYYQIQIREGRHNAFVSIAMEYVSGGDLASLFEKLLVGEAKLNSSEMNLYITQLAAGLDYLHQRNIMHGDIKPANVLMKRIAPRVWRLLIADLDDRAEMEQSVTQSADVTHIRGTARYMAPEMAARFLKQDPVKPGRKADVWSLGCIILDMVNFSDGHTIKEMQNRGFFWTDTFVITEYTTSGQILFKVANGYTSDSSYTSIPVIPASVPKDLDSLIKGCISTNVSERFTAAAVKEYANELLNQACANNPTSANWSPPIRTCLASLERA